ncbi:hypothetical protein DL546_004569 [Coniochaeta pulveracea]|uniref:Uncharacterized protein n=1 Tax=Coniochaeta pulveracea TaxID=177199 RepID=A0A420Y8U4_9PEZI|nr:hypothetical protein DL546_004569 [Coniochaeta pulveracea]
MRFGSLVALGGLASMTRACLQYGLAFDLVDSFIDFSFVDDGTTTCSGRWYNWQGGDGEEYWAPNCLAGYQVRATVCDVFACPSSSWIILYTTPHGTWEWRTGNFGFIYNGHSAAGVLDNHFC